MASDTFDLPLAGPTKKQYVYIGGAALGGVLVYAYYNRARELSAEAEAEEDPEYYEGQYPYISSGGAGPSVVEEEEDTDRIETNGDWSQFVIDYMQRYGYEAQTVSSAIGKFLGRQPLTAAEADIVRTAMGIAGEPPQNKPWQVIMATGPGAAVGLPAPANLKAKSISPNSITWQWDPVTGAEGYDVELVAGISTVWQKETIHETAWTPDPKYFKAGHSYRINVWAKNNANQRGAKGTRVDRTSTSATGPKPGITLAIDSGRTFLRVRWGRVPGATHYVVWPIIGNQKQPQKRGGANNTYTWNGLQPNHRYGFEVVAMKGNKELSTRKKITGVTKR